MTRRRHQLRIADRVGHDAATKTNREEPSRAQIIRTTAGLDSRRKYLCRKTFVGRSDDDDPDVDEHGGCDGFTPGRVSPTGVDGVRMTDRDQSQPPADDVRRRDADRPRVES